MEMHMSPETKRTNGNRTSAAKRAEKALVLEMEKALELQKAQYVQFMGEAATIPNSTLRPMAVKATRAPIGLAVVVTEKGTKFAIHAYQPFAKRPDVLPISKDAAGFASRELALVWAVQYRMANPLERVTAK
jgi:hypothetical protein